MGRARHNLAGIVLTTFEQFFDTQTDILGDLAQQDRGNIPTGVERHGSAATIGMTELLVGTALSGFDEAERLQEGNDLAWLENRDARHTQATFTV